MINNNQDVGLLPCPFCGAADAHNQSDYGDENQAVCAVCDARGPMRRSYSEAITAWNTRTPSSQREAGEVSELVERLRPLPEAQPNTWLLVRIAWPDEQRDGLMGKIALGMLREGRFWGKQTRGWWAPSGGMWIDGCVAGWAPLEDAALFGFPQDNIADALASRDAETLNVIAVMMSEFVDNWPPHKKLETSLALIAKTLRASRDEVASLKGRLAEAESVLRMIAADREIVTNVDKGTRRPETLEESVSFARRHARAFITQERAILTNDGGRDDG